MLNVYALHIRIFVSRKFLVSNEKRHDFILLGLGIKNTGLTVFWFRIKNGFCNYGPKLTRLIMAS